MSGPPDLVDENPYRSPQLYGVSEHVDAPSDRNNWVRRLWLNLQLFFVVTMIEMLLIVLDVTLLGQPPRSLPAMLQGLVLVLTVPVSCFVNWRITQSDSQPARVAFGLLIGCAACCVGYLPLLAITLTFHLLVGGTF